MLEIIIPGVRHGEAVMDGTSVRKGALCYISGVNADGYQLLNAASTLTNSMLSLYPVNKYRMEEDLSDTSDAVDIIGKGELVLYYEGGEYETDQFDQNSMGLTATYWDNVETLASSNWGRKTYVPGSSTAQATATLRKLWVSTGGNGILFGDTANHGGLAVGSHIGFVLGVHYTDSADARLRFRIAPGNLTEAI